ncbi:hypothetical protein F4775DRAFT_598985 [Biscogniauxia sp. FL1348]|nr:hypothetical protein F4775DRAFT_598985 [Biscogniauxia sp. FL1348]
MKLHTLFLVFSVVQAYQAHPPFHNEILHEQCISRALGPLDPKIEISSCPLVVDDETSFERRSWHPWTFPPVCMKAENDTHSKLCTFTYANLRGEAGISILTTPEIAAAGMEVLEDIDLRLPAWERDHMHTASIPPPYEIKSIEGKGLGVIASRQIHQGEIIMLQYPVVLRMIDIEPWKYQDVLTLLHRAAMQLPTKEKAAILSLARSRGGYIVDDIMNTNSYSVLLDGVAHQGLYVDVSVSKQHVFNRVSSTTLAMEIVAYRDIDEGEELTASYTPLNLLSDQRESLIREWGFNCTCSLCASREERDTSDRRRTDIQSLLKELEEPRFRHHTAISERVDKILDLCEKEGLRAQVGDFYAIVADVYSARGDVESAEKYGRMAVEELRYYAGYDNERTRNAITFLEELDARL